MRMDLGVQAVKAKPLIVIERQIILRRITDDFFTSTTQRMLTETSSVMSPLKVDKDWKEKFFHPANHVRVEEPKKARENTAAPIIEDWVSDDEEENEAPLNTVRSVNTARPFSTARSVNTVRPYYTAHPKSTVSCARPKTHFQNQAQSTVQRPFYKSTALTKKSNSQLNDKGFIDSGCSRHMSGNIAHLSDFKDL
ncbi:hypothetical protein Tco_1484284 [Tanacetum coccineum]